MNHPNATISPASLPRFDDEAVEPDATTRAQTPPTLFQLAGKYPPKFSTGLKDSARYQRSPQQPEASDTQPDEDQLHTAEVFDVAEPPAAYRAPSNEVDTAGIARAIMDASLLASAEFSTESCARLLEEEHTDLTPEQKHDVQKIIAAHLEGLGPLEPLLELDGITDIYVNSPADVWVDGSFGMHKTDLQFDHEDAVRSLATRLVTSCGARLDESVPANDVQTERGQRVHAVLPPVAGENTVLSIRVQPARRLTLDQWLAHSNPQLMPVLISMMKTRANFVISGGTGSGKTTLLNALLGLCAEEERLVTLEDSPELAPAHAHTVALTSRAANAEGRGAITLQMLIQQALRMGPDRLILGESRGAEINDLLMAMNTGHSGSGSTVHANSADATPARIIAMGALAGLTPQATSLQAATALDYVIHCQKVGGHRIITQISRFELNNHELQTVPCCSVNPTTGRLKWHTGGIHLREAMEQAL